MKVLDETVRSLLAESGFSIDDFLDAHITLQDGECVLLGGTAVEDLPACWKSFDILVIGGAVAPFADRRTVRPSEPSVTLEICRPSDLACLASTMQVLAHALTNASGPDVLDLFSGLNDRRLLHRIKTGVVLANEAGVEQWRGRLRLASLEHVLALAHAVDYMDHRAGADAALNRGDLETCSWMVTASARAMAGAVLASSGETNPDPRWLLKLLSRHRERVGGDVADALKQLLLAPPLTASAVGLAMGTLDSALATVVERLAPVAAVEDFLFDASKRSERPPPPDVGLSATS